MNVQGTQRGHGKNDRFCAGQTCMNAQGAADAAASGAGFCAAGPSRTAHRMFPCNRPMQRIAFGAR